MAKCNVGEKHPRFVGYFWMKDLDTGQRWRFASTHGCSLFGRKELGLTLCQTTVYVKLNDQSKLPYLNRYKFIWC